MQHKHTRAPTKFTLSRVYGLFEKGAFAVCPPARLVPPPFPVALVFSVFGKASKMYRGVKR